MKAAVLHEYGGPNKLKYEDITDPQPGPGEVRVRVLATSVNPVDYKMRSGEAKQRFPVTFPGILGRDVAGVVECLGEGVKDLALGDRVFGLANGTYAEFCVVAANTLARVPEGLEMVQASAVPLVSITGDVLMRKGAEAQSGQTILLTGALGSVGRCALFCAAEIGAKVIAGVRKKQIDEAKALGAVEAIDLDDEDDLARVGLVDAVADTVGGKLAPKLLAKVKPGGAFGSVLGPPAGAALHPLARVNAVMAQPDAAVVAHYGEAVRDGRLAIPVSQALPLSEAKHAHELAEKHGTPGKIVLVP